MRVEISSRCFPKELVSFVCPRELASFDQPHVTRPPPTGKYILVGRYNNNTYPTDSDLSEKRIPPIEQLGLDEKNSDDSPTAFETLTNSL